MHLSDLTVEKKTGVFEYPGTKLNVELAFLPASEWQAIRKRCTRIDFNKQHQQVEVLDDKKWLREFTKAIIIGWSGLTVGLIKTMAPVSVKEGITDETEIKYSEDFALFMMQECQEFANWVITFQERYETFARNQQEVTEKNS